MRDIFHPPSIVFEGHCVFPGGAVRGKTGWRSVARTFCGLACDD